MKRITAALLLISSMGVFAQNISDYKYIYVPKKFADFKTNNAYNLNKILTLKLQDKNYTVVSDDRENWPVELRANPCSLLNGTVENDSSFLRNKIILKFTDCNDKTVSEIKTSSLYKEYDEGFQDALVKAVLNVPVSAPNAAAIQSSPQNVAETKTEITTPENKQTSTASPAKVQENKPATEQQVPARP